MTFSLWTVVRFVHVLSAVIWVGGQIAMSLIVRPAALRAIDDENRKALFTHAGTRFARLSTLALMPALLGTGLALAWHRGVDFGMLARPGYGLTLGIKISLAFVSLALAILHGIVVSREGGAARILGVTGLVVSVTVVLLAVALVP